MSPYKFLSKLVDDKDPVIIMPYGGYMNDTHVYAQARVLEDEGIVHEEDDGAIKNIFNTFKRFESDEIENAHVEVSMANASKSFKSDDEGYVYADFQHGLTVEKLKDEWQALKYDLSANNKVIYSIVDNVLYPSKKASFGIISDMDDTVLETGLSSTFKWKVIVNSFFKHSSKRLPLDGVQEFYEQLRKGKSGKDDNPFFYLSNSPWNLYEYLSDFLNYQGLPKGVLLLRDIGLEHKKKKRFQERNKYLKISHILNTYPDMAFVLIGDAVDLDHEIYIEIARNFPNRIIAIYIRTTKNKKKMAAVKRLIEQTTHTNVILIEHSNEAIAHAEEHNLISKF